MKPTIVFISAVCPGQHSLLCDYLNESGLAKAYYLTTPGHCETNKNRHKNLIPFQPDGNIVKLGGYYYSNKTERSARISLGVYRSLKNFVKDHKVDLVVAHALWGAPYFLYDEIDIPVISYMEFPSYRKHGWDPKYPPDECQRLTDANMEMVQYYQLLRSDLVTVPSAYAKSLFPSDLQHKIRVQFEGFKTEAAPPARQRSGEDDFVLGFAARDISSAKGYETFAAVSQSLNKRGSKIKCVALGSDKVSGYGYEQLFVQRYYKDNAKGFADYIKEKYPDSNIELLGRLPYEEYAKTIHSIDLFLYPLQFGVANWGFIEILSRGKAVVASNRCFIPEIVRHGESAYLIDEPTDIESWVDAIQKIRSDDTLKRRLEAGAAEIGKDFQMSVVAPNYMKMFNEVIEMHSSRSQQR